MVNMSYDEFKKALLDQLSKKLGKTTRAGIIPVNKNNGNTKEAVRIENGKTELKPLIYVNSLYEQYCMGAALSVCVGFIIGLYHAMPEFHAEKHLGTWDEVKTKIGIRIINWDWNQAELKEIPYKKHLDLAVYCRIILAKNEDGIASAIVKKSMLKYWGVSEKELWETAKTNFQKEKFIIRHIDEEIGYPKQYLDKFANLHRQKDETYVLTNEYRNHGAAGMLRLDLLKKFVEQIQGNFYILPSSVNEVILLPDRGDKSPEFLRSLVKKNNKDYASEEELSENIYYYRRERNRIEVVL